MAYHISKSLKRVSSRGMRLFIAAATAVAIVVGNIPLAQAAGPTATVTSPVANSVHQGVINMQATTAGSGTLGVTFKITGAYVNWTSAEDTTAPYAASWDSAPLSLNKVDYNITATARWSGGKNVSPIVKVKLNNAPFPNKVMVLGDSVSQQAYDWDANGSRNFTASAPGVENTDFRVFAYMGWAVPNVQQVTYDHSVFRWPKKLVIAMGLNDAVGFPFSDGWTAADLVNFQTLINTVHPNTCVVMVLPGYGATGDTPWFGSWAAEVDKARPDLENLVANRPNSVVVDWQDVIDEHPEYVDNDGIHLLTPNSTWEEDTEAASNGQMNPVDQTAAEARQNFYWDSAAQCTP